jgi:hypothetical protein
VKGRENLTGNSWKSELHKYIAGIIKGKDLKPIEYNEKYLFEWYD